MWAVLEPYYISGGWNFPCWFQISLYWCRVKSKIKTENSSFPGWNFLCWSQISPYWIRVKSRINTENSSFPGLNFPCSFQISPHWSRVKSGINTENSNPCGYSLTSVVNSTQVGSTMWSSMVLWDIAKYTSLDDHFCFEIRAGRLRNFQMERDKFW